MNQWNGLMKKEWASMKTWFFAMVTGSVLLVAVLPFLLTLIFGRMDVVGGSLMIGSFWALLSTFLPLVVLVTSLNDEMKHPDIWLHSNASCFKLFGVKAIFAFLVCSISFLFPAFIMITQHSFSNLMVEASFNEVTAFSVIFTLSLFMTAILIMGTGLFFWVIYHLIKPYLRGFSIPVTIGLFLAAVKLFGWVTDTNVYRKIAEIRPFGEALGREFKFNQGNSFIHLEDSIFYSGEIILNMLLITGLFVSASYLFEKRVRI